MTATQILNQYKLFVTIAHMMKPADRKARLAAIQANANEHGVTLTVR